MKLFGFHLGHIFVWQNQRENLKNLRIEDCKENSASVTPFLGEGILTNCLIAITVFEPSVL